MKTMLLLLTLLTTISLAEAKVFKAYNGDIDFNHSKHMGLYPCAECHDGPARAFGIDKAKGHKLCIGCHKKEGVGPTNRCSGCHGNADQPK
jgi:cytochrome c553